MNTTIAPAGARTVIYQIRQGSIPVELNFLVQPLDDNEELHGELEITASSWIIPGTPERMPLQSRHQVRRGMWNTFFTLAVIPQVDVKISPSPRESSGKLMPFFVITLLIVTFIIVITGALVYSTL